jgi:hypothetical protein
MGVRFKRDENLPADAESLLRNVGHDVDTVLSEGLGGRPDPMVLAAAKFEGRVLVTLDLDFSNVRQYPPSDYCGIWVLRPHTQSIANTLGPLARALALVETETVHARLWVIEPGQVRIRE